MKIFSSILVAMLMIFSSFTFAAGGDSKSELDRNRDSAPYKKQIFSNLKKIEHFKWSNGEADGYIITHETGMKFNWNDDYIKNGVFVKVKRFHYGKLLTEFVGYARQSKWDGYMEIYNFNNRDQQLHIKLVDDDTMHVYYHTYASEERFTFEKVKEFNTNNPYGNIELEDAEESGIIF